MPKIAKTEGRAAYATDTDLAAHFGVNRATIWAWVKRNEFPAPVRLSPQMTRWKWSDVEAWEAAQASAGSAV
ncbi:MAG: AlpA family phage regulatory protein [Rhodobacteraceae bacterium]|nr:AlpA family phage regulatory protein [Paracoccaceae bacterium]MCZ8082991.1 AlpA family phage regulatory protein [Paracoccaceae bacterium]